MNHALPHAHACDPQLVDLDQKMTARTVARRFDVSVRTVDRWLEQPHMEFPRPVMFTHDRTGRVANRYWLLRDIVAWEREQGLARERRRKPKACVVKRDIVEAA